MTSEPARQVFPSGEQFEIVYGDQRATIVEVGGGIREYEVDGRPVLDPYPLDAMCDGAHGAVLVPWPNRLGDGRYDFDGTEQQVALSEPEKENALHGLLRWRSWSPSERTIDRIVMSTTLHPMKGYPFCLRVDVAYQIDDAGLTVATTSTNAGAEPCPYGCGHHPYLSPGTGLIDDCKVELEAGSRIATDDQRKLPTGVETVRGTRFDFSGGRRLGDDILDEPFTDLRRDDSGRAWVRLWGSDGRCVELWADEHYPILELFTGDTLAADRRRNGLGTEPMTCPPNALQTGEHVVRLEPDQRISTTWGVRLR